ncbi:MAG: sulfatase-like hydrolase/transferase [Planctomycetes bacterium]|nr:sulfatase-like hydrolase/transferase [Planctomycetota bacterium]
MMKRKNLLKLMSAALTAITLFAPAISAQKKESTQRPNLIVIHTDEHNFRTLGCYRDLMSEDQAYIWGKGVKVDTPNIDSLAKEGAICTSYYAASPVCTPSRASLLTGLYPQVTGSPKNDMPLNDDIVTFAELFRRNGYATSYVGKWHLDGHDKPGFAPKRKFGFEDNRYMINRGHWKMLTDSPDGVSFVGSFNESKNKYTFDINQADPENFTTDYLMNKTIDIIDRDKGKPFCLMLSIPDPHGPNQVRVPYDTMYSGMKFQDPKSMNVKGAKVPKWCSQGKKNSVKKFQEKDQRQNAWYFGMVKCIDDNMGKLIAYLKKNGPCP